MTSIIKVEGIKSRRQLRAKVPAGGETRDIRSGRVLSSRPGAEAPGSDAKGCKARVVVGKGATNEAAQGSGNVSVG